MDEMLRRLKARFGGRNGGRYGDSYAREEQTSGSGDSPEGGRLTDRLSTNRKWAMGGLAGAVILPIALSFPYIVNTGENAVVTTFGKYTSTETGGLHFKVPLVQSVAIVNVETIGEERVDGIEYDEKGQQRSTQKTDKETHMLTGDENIISVSGKIQYNIKDPVGWLFSSENPKNILRSCYESSVRQEAGSSSIDDVLFGKRDVINTTVKQLTQRCADNYNTGINIIGVQFTRVQPPGKVKEAFDSVQIAREGLTKSVNKAETYRNEKIPQAEAKAKQYLNEAESYKAQVINEATGDANRFLAVFAEYRKAPDITKRRMVIDANIDVFGRAEVYVIPDGKSLNFLPLGKSGLEKAIAGGNAK